MAAIGSTRVRKWSGGPCPRGGRAGRIALEIPKLRRGSYLPSFLEPRRTTEKALAAAIQQACVHGVATRSVDGLVKAMGAGGMSRNLVSRLCPEIDERVNAFPTRPLEGAWRSPLSSDQGRTMARFWLDATCVKVRAGGRIVSRTVMIDVAVNEAGNRVSRRSSIPPQKGRTFKIKRKSGLLSHAAQWEETRAFLNR